MNAGFAGRGAWVLVSNEPTELRELDRRRNTHAPGSPARAATILHLARAAAAPTIGATRTG